MGAFRVVIELDMKRRDNDKKIGVLFVEMRDMMEALLQCVYDDPLRRHFYRALTLVQIARNQGRGERRA